MTTHTQNSQQAQQLAQPDPVGNAVGGLTQAVLVLAIALVLLPLAVPLLVGRVAGEVIATKTRFWMVWPKHWLLNVVGILLVIALLTVESFLIARWISTGDATELFDQEPWVSDLASLAVPWLVANFVSGIALLPVAWSIRRRRIADQVRTRRISDVVRQEKIETARKRAADRSAALKIGVRVDGRTGTITGTTPTATTAPNPLPSGLQGFGVVSRITVRTMADRFHDSRQVRDWIDSTGTQLVLPSHASAVRALLVAESGSGKTVLINNLVLCAIEYGWPVFVIDAKGDPTDSENLVHAATSRGRRAVVGATWDLFNGTADQITAKLMRLMPLPDGANQHYLDEIRGVLQAIQGDTPLTGVQDLRTRLLSPAPYVRDQYDLSMVNRTVDRDGTTAGRRALHSLLVALRPLERWIGEDGWSFTHPHADVTVVPLSPIDDAQARLGDLLMIDLRNYLADRLQRRDKTPVLVVVDEFPQLVTTSQDPGDSAGSLFETARSAGVGLVLATQSPAGLSNDEVRRRRALASGAALIFGRSKDPEDVVKYAGTIMRMEANGRATGEELGAARAQHSFVIPPQDVREAADGAFWLVQAGAVAPFRAYPTGTTSLSEPEVLVHASGPAGVQDSPSEDPAGAEAEVDPGTTVT